MEHNYQIDVTAKSGYYIPISKNQNDIISLSFMSKKMPYHVPSNLQIYLLEQSTELDKAIIKKQYPSNGNRIQVIWQDIGKVGRYYLVFVTNRITQFAIPLYFFYQIASSQPTQSNSQTDLGKTLTEINRLVASLKDIDNTYAKINDLRQYIKKSELPDLEKFLTSDEVQQIVSDYVNQHGAAIDQNDVKELISQYIEQLELKNGQDGYTPVRGKDYMNNEDIEAINSTISSSVAEYVEEHKSELKGERGKDGQSIKGDKGADGKSAYETWISLGNSGTEEDFINSLKGEKGDSIKGDKGDSVKGDKGDTGLSAYEVWLKNGNEGTELDFLHSLKGERGADGDVGEINMESYLRKDELDTELTPYAKKDEISTLLDMTEYAKKTDVLTVPTTDIDFDDTTKWEVE